MLTASRSLSLHAESGKELPPQVIERVLSKVVPGDGGCLLSTYATSANGYARTSWGPRGREIREGVHRVAWIATHGPIPEGMTVHHKCFNRTCVNVEHLGLMEHFENSRRTNGEDWEIGTCKEGHSNDWLRKIGPRRRCLLCYQAKTRRATAKRRQRKREARERANGK